MIVNENVDFYYVWTKKGHVPRVAHNTHAKALAEAERLARLHPSRKFIVLMALDKVSYQEEKAAA